MKLNTIVASKPALAKAMLLTLLTSTSTMAIEPESTPASFGDLKIAVVKDAVGTNEIVSGDYTAGLTKLDSTPENNMDAFEIAMGACVANLKLKALIDADLACTEAIRSLDSVAGRSRHGKYLKSLAYSNRAIVRYLSEDSDGAMQDFTSALLADDNAVVKDNIIALREISTIEADAEITAVAD